MNRNTEDLANRGIKYHTGFSAGALLIKESEAAISGIQDVRDFLDMKENIDPSVIPVNSESSKARLAREVSRRFRKIDSPDLINLFIEGETQDKKLILFYAACKTYQLIADFMLEVVLDKWYNLDIELSSQDFQNFMYKKMDTHPELEAIKINQIKKISSRPIQMLKDLGLLANAKLQKLDFNITVLKHIVKNGDSWFLEVLLLNKDEREEILAR